MKRTYTKPTLYAEKFELMEHISSCVADPAYTTVTYRDRSSCSYRDGDITLFNNTGVNGCLNNFDSFMFPGGVDEYLQSHQVEGGGCYNAFSNGNVFAS